MEWEVASAPLNGDDSSGDLHLVKIDKDIVLFSAMDGVGQGRAACLASMITRSVIEQNSKEILPKLFSLCHDNLKKSVGVALSLARVDRKAATLTWSGVGDVAMIVVSQSKKITSYDNPEPKEVLGKKYSLPQSITVGLKKSDVLVLATNGIAPHFWEGIDFNKSCFDIGHEILSRYGKRDDDALVLVARPLS